jgi:inner membrane protein
MDSITQFSLGACVGTAVLGRRMGVRKAAVTGGLLAVLPDADVFWPFDGPIDSFVLHRSLTHSLPVHALITPVFAEGLRRFAGSLREARWQTYLAVFLCLATHALLDSLTVYGTRLFWPLWPDAVGLGSVFIIDPLYTLPLLLVTLAALFGKRWSRGFARALGAALALSTAYLGWGAAAQQLAYARAERVLAGAKISPERMIATPTPFNSLFWRVIAVDGGRYFNIYVPLLGDESTITAYAHPRRPASVDCLERNRLVATLSDFTDGFYRFDTRDGALVMADLRMGLPPLYVFAFAVAEHGSAGFVEIAPRRIESERESPGDMDWLKAGIMGRRAVRPAEASAAVDLETSDRARVEAPRGAAC